MVFSYLLSFKISESSGFYLTAYHVLYKSLIFNKKCAVMCFSVVTAWQC